MHELPESVLLRELVYVFQGIEGKYIKYDAMREGFRIDSKVQFSTSPVMANSLFSQDRNLLPSLKKEILIAHLTESLLSLCPLI